MNKVDLTSKKFVTIGTRLLVVLVKDDKGYGAPKQDCVPCQ
jgi:hypothetical protein